MVFPVMVVLAGGISRVGKSPIAIKYCREGIQLFGRF
jgi:2-phosphoglycerate kinase